MIVFNIICIFIVAIIFQPSRSETLIFGLSLAKPCAVDIYGFETNIIFRTKVKEYGVGSFLRPEGHILEVVVIIL